MKTNAITLVATALCGTAAAVVNINAFTSYGCKDSAYTTCQNVAPNTCCVSLVEFGSEQHGARSGQFVDLPDPSTALGYTPAPATNDGCGNITTTYSSTGGLYCSTIYPEEGEFTGLAWYEGPATKRSLQNYKCSSSVYPDMLTLKDGQQYDLTKMSTTMVGQLWDLGVQGVTKTQVPSQFAQYEM